MRKIAYSVVVALMLFLGIFISCEKENHHIFISDIDEVAFLPGNQRAKLVIKLDQIDNAKEIVVFWNDLEDERIIPISKNVNDGVYELMVENMSEGDISFHIYLRDETNNKSQVKSVYGHVYGDTYLSSLKNRFFVEAEVTPENAILKWLPSPDGAKEFEVIYLDNNDEEKVVSFDASKDVIYLKNAKSGSIVKYRIKYLPEEGCIDPFFCEWEEITIGLAPLEEFMLDKSIIAEHHLQNDKSGQNFGGSIASLFDGIVNVNNFYSSIDGEQPLTFTFDLGQSVILSRITITGRPALGDRIPKEFDVWAINDISGADTETATSDFEAWEEESISKGWKKVTENPGDLSKPDPDPNWDNPPIRDFLIAEDRDAKYRYIRIRVKSTWQDADISGQSVNIGEIDIYGKK